MDEKSMEFELIELGEVSEETKGVGSKSFDDPIDPALGRQTV